MIIAAMALLLMAPAAGATDTRQAVLLHKGGKFECIAGAALDRPVAATVRHGWVWSGTSAPRRVMPNELGRTLPPESEKLRVTLSRRADVKPGPINVVAGPVGMWREVPEPLLPRFSLAKDGTLLLPKSASGPWRLRALGTGTSSEWVDIEAGRSRVALVLVPTTDLSVSATALGGSLPSRLAFLRVYRDPRATPGRPEVVAVFEANGPRQFLVPSFPSGAPFLLLFTAPAVAPVVTRTANGGGTITINLERGAELRGVLTDRAGKPLQNAGAVAQSVASPELPVTIPRGATTLSDGSWRLSGLPPGKTALLLAGEGMVPERRELQLGEGELDLGTIGLQPAVQLPVRVIDDVGSPISGALVSVVSTGGGSVTDSKGLAMLRAVGTGARLALIVKAPHCRPKELTITPPFGDEVAVSVERAVTLTGRAVDPDGVPITDVQGRIEMGKASEAIAAVSGTFSLLLPGGTAARLVLRSPASEEFALQIAPGQPGEERDLGDVKIASGLAVIGRVLDSADGTPIPGARVWAPRPSKDGPLMSWMHQDLLQASTREDGTFQILGASPGSLVLHTEAVDFARSELELTVRTGSGADAGDIRLARGATVNVRLRPAREGEAVARIDLRGQWRDFDMLTGAVRDSSGVIENVPAGHYTLSVIQGSRLLCETKIDVPDNRTAVSATCSTTGNRVVGHVFFGASPAGPGALTWTAVSDQPIADGIMTQVLGGGLRQQQVYTGRRPSVVVPVGAGGSFETQELAPGAWRASFVPSGGSGPTPPQAVEIPESEMFEVVLRFAGRNVTGVVLDDEDHAVPSARVREFENGGIAISDDAGRFSVAGLQPGLHHLQAQASGQWSDRSAVEIAEDREPDPMKLVISKQNSTDLTIRVLASDGRGVSGAFVIVDQPSGGQIVTADSDGRTEVRISKPFPPQIRCAAFVGNGWVFGEWFAWDEARRGMTLAMRNAGNLALRSGKSAGSLQLVSAGGWDVALLMRRLGMNTTVDPGGSVALQGLPEGAYDIALGQWSKSVAIQRGRETAVEAP